MVTSRVYIVTMTVLIDGQQKVLHTVVRAKSPKAARNKVIDASVNVRRATVDDFAPPEVNETSETSEETEAS